MCKRLWSEPTLALFIRDGSVYMDTSFWDHWSVGNREDDGNEDPSKVHLRQVKLLL